MVWGPGVQELQNMSEGWLFKSLKGIVFWSFCQKEIPDLLEKCPDFGERHKLHAEI